MKTTTAILGRAFGERNAATLNLIISNLGLAGGKLILDGGIWLIDDDVTFPANLAVEILPDASIYVSLNKILTINSLSFIIHSASWVEASSAGTVTGVYSGVNAGRFMGYSKVSELAQRIAEAGIGTGLELADGILQVKQATTGLLGGAVKASATDAKNMTDANKFLTPALLAPFINTNIVISNYKDRWAIAGTSSDSQRAVFPFSVKITPVFPDSRIVLFGMFNVSCTNGRSAIFLNRKIGTAAATEIGNANPSGVKTPCFMQLSGADAAATANSFVYMDALNLSELAEIEYFFTVNLYSTYSLVLNGSIDNAVASYNRLSTSNMIAIEIPKKN